MPRETLLSFSMETFKNIAVQNSFVRLNFYQLFASDQSSKFYFSAPSFCFAAFVNYLLSSLFTSLSVTLLLYIRASKWNHRHNKQKEYGLVINKLSWSNRPRISKNTGGIGLFLMQNSYWNSYYYCYWNNYWHRYC